MKFLCFVCFATLSLVSAQEPLSQQAQQALAEQIAAKAQHSEIWTDDDGNVTGLILINHQALNEKAPGSPGIDDSDLAKLTQFPKLTAINLEGQAVGDVGLAALTDLSQLKQVGYHYMRKHPQSSVTADSAAVINGKPELEILEIKHNFRVKRFAIETITTEMPKVWRLVLDTPITPEQTLQLIRLCPNVTDLQLHRSNCTPEQLAEIGQLLPKLEVLWWKPRGELEAEDLKALAEFKKLKIFSPQHFKNQLPFEGGWDALLEVPKLERLEVAVRDDENGAALVTLREKKPELVIDAELTRSRNYKGL